MAGRIETLPLFPSTTAALLELLAELPADAWRLPTVHRDRTVKDLVAHLLDGAMRRLAFQRDGWVAPAPAISSSAELVAYIQEINRAWMKGAARMSPRMLIELLRKFEAEVVEMFAALDPDAPAPWSVDWAGESESLNWFDIARDYTERWHHQQQIRDALGRPGLTDREHMHPALATFMRGLPHAWRAVAAPAGTRVRVVIEGDAGGAWQLVRGADRWQLDDGDGHADATATVDQDAAWRIVTRGLAPADARARIRGEGPEELVAPLSRMVCVMA